MYQEPPVIQRPASGRRLSPQWLDWRSVARGFVAAGVLATVFVCALSLTQHDVAMGRMPAAPASGDVAVPVAPAQTSSLPTEATAAATPGQTTAGATIAPELKTATQSPSPIVAISPTDTHTPAPCGTAPMSWGDRAGWVPYTIHEGENPLSLALNTGTTLAAILQANCLPSVDSIRPGVNLLLPRPVPTAPAYLPSLMMTPVPLPPPPGCLPWPPVTGWQPYVAPTSAPMPTLYPTPLPTVPPAVTVGPIPMEPPPAQTPITYYPTPAPTVVYYPQPIPTVDYIPAPIVAPAPYNPPPPPPAPYNPPPAPPLNPAPPPDVWPVHSTPQPGQPIGPIPMPR